MGWLIRSKEEQAEHEARKRERRPLRQEDTLARKVYNKAESGYNSLKKDYREGRAQQKQRDFDRAIRETGSTRRPGILRRTAENWWNQRSEERVATRKGKLRGIEERGYHEGRGYKSRTQIMAERPPRYADGRGYGQGRAPRYRAEARRQYQEERREAYQPPQKPVDVLSSINSYESRVLGRKPKRR